MSRRAGLLLHPSSLPGPFGIGDIGPAARRFAGWLGASGHRIWQVLPLHPTEPRGSPYTSPSAFARNPLLLSPDDLLEDGWLRRREMPPRVRPGPVDFAAVRASRAPLLAMAADRVACAVDLTAAAGGHPWMDGWALFDAIASELGEDWSAWPEPLRHRDPDAIAAARDRCRGAVERAVALQWLFRGQWARLREEAGRQGVELWGDVPIFVGHHSADVWLAPELFQLDEAGAPRVVSGCPPDAFAPAGQLWGHPLYAVERHRACGYRWWLDRLGVERELFDCLRFDHFRGLAAMWAVPYGATDARGGRWVEGLGAGLLAAIGDAFGEIPLYAEDLGIITPDVVALRDRFGLRGMAVLQFAFGGDPDHPYLPHRHGENTVACTSTHDTDTLAGWLASTDAGTRARVAARLGGATPGHVVRAAWESVAQVALVPMQDLLGLGSPHRLNTPGVAEGNWRWRLRAFPDDALAAELRAGLARAGRV